MIINTCCIFNLHKIPDRLGRSVWLAEPNPILDHIERLQFPRSFVCLWANERHPGGVVLKNATIQEG